MKRWIESVLLVLRRDHDYYGNLVLAAIVGIFVVAMIVAILTGRDDLFRDALRFDQQRAYLLLN